MNELIKADQVNTGLINNSGKKGLSPYDPIFPIAFLSSSMQASLVEAERVTEELYSTVTKLAPTATQLSQVKEGSRFVVDMTDEMIKRVQKGEIKLTTNKAGETFAQIVNENGIFGKKLPIKMENYAVNLDPTAMATAIQLKAMQEKLEEMSAQINQIDRNVHEVLEGQQNDRIAQYYSGVSLYVEALSIEDAEVKRAVIAQALRALTDSTFQLRLNMQMDITYLKNGEYKNEKGKRTKLIDERMANINQEFAYIHQAALFKAGIYCNEREFGAMASVLDEYSFFIKNNISNNAGFLSQCDVGDNGSNEGIWRARADLNLDTTEIRKALTSQEKTLYLSILEEEDYA